MKAFELFKAGKHTSAGGSTLSFSEEDLRAAVAAYDPAVHEAPIVIGHPKDNHPAWGWVKSLSYTEGAIVAEPQQVDEAFAEMVVAGRFKKRSASFYTPDSPNNPKPGTYYLRHVGFLGAQPPAVKGLKDVAFSDGDQSVEVEFGESDRWAWSSLLALLRGWRESIIADKGIEAADKLAPSYLLSDIEAASRAPAPAATVNPAFSEGNDMDIKELQAEVARLTAANATLTSERDTARTAAAKVTNFAEAETALAARETAIAAREKAIAEAIAEANVKARVDAAVKAGKLLPGAAARTLSFAMGLADGEATIDFGEGDKAKKVSQREAYLLEIESRTKAVEYGELSADKKGEGGAADIDALQRQIAAQVASGGAAK